MYPIALADMQQIAPCTWEIPRSFRNDMRVNARLYANREMVEHLLADRSLEQLVNTATFPGVQEPVLAMPDIHQGYGFPIGGVVAVRAEDGVISPGGVGYDINCGVRLLASTTTHKDIGERLAALATQIQRNVPTGVGRSGRIKLSDEELDAVLDTGMHWAITAGHASESDAELVEENGCFAAASADAVPERAKKRGIDQLGTLGAGNHFLEVQRVESITVPDRALSCAPFKDPEGQAYFHAMAAAANFAWCNRQVITHAVREAWRAVLGAHEALALVYDVSHNVAKLEDHGGVLCVVHRKGATRAFGPGHEELPARYRKAGQPVFIPGSMGTASYVLSGTETAMQESFGSTCHGAGRQLSRRKAKETVVYDRLCRALHDAGIEVRAASAKGLIEEAPEAYKAVDQVVDVMAETGIAVKVARLRPIAIVKG